MQRKHGTQVPRPLARQVALLDGMFSFQTIKQALSPQADRRKSQRPSDAPRESQKETDDEVDLEGLNSTPHVFYEAECDPVEYELTQLGDQPTPERIRETCQARTRSLHVRPCRHPVQPSPARPCLPSAQH